MTFAIQTSFGAVSEHSLKSLLYVLLYNLLGRAAAQNVATYQVASWLQVSMIKLYHNNYFKTLFVNCN